jgi:hypothetical protein
MNCSFVPAQSTNIVSPAMCVYRIVGETGLPGPQRRSSKIPLAAPRTIDDGCRPDRQARRILRLDPRQ